MNKNEKLRMAANEFSQRVQGIGGVLEIAIVGSVAGLDSHPDDLDLAMIVSHLDELPTIAEHARKIGGHYHGWEVFLFDEDVKYIGRICHRRECPGGSVDCHNPTCGRPHYLMVIPGYEYDERLFFNSPIDVLFTSSKTSRFIAQRNELGIIATRKYVLLKDMEIECMICGEPFTFTAQQQKWFDKRGLSRPKRCDRCKEREAMEELMDLGWE